MKSIRHGKHETYKSRIGKITILFISVLFISVVCFYMAHQSGSHSSEDAAVPTDSTEVHSAISANQPSAHTGIEPDCSPAPSSAVAENVDAEPDENNETVIYNDPVFGDISNLAFNPDSNIPVDSKTYQLITDIVYSYHYKLDSAKNDIENKLTEIDSVNPVLGTVWRMIMDSWFYSNEDFEANPNELPKGLPEDKSLCIVVLGFQLYLDGGMSPELEGRLNTALHCAEQYPEAYIAVTGGGTALYSNKTEAGVMAEWLIDHGIDESRIIIENRSLTTCENAEFTMSLIYSAYPQIKHLAIVTSDYHAALACLLFRVKSVLNSYCSGTDIITVLSDACYMTGTGSERCGIDMQAQYVWSLADVLF